MKHKLLKKELTAQFYQKNRLNFGIALFGALLSGSLNLIVSWIMQQLIDVASGAEGMFGFETLVWISGGFLVFCAAVMLLTYFSEPRFLARAMRQYRDFAFRRLTEKSISSFRDESTATYLSALTNDAASIEADDLAQQLSVITKLVTAAGALAMMLYYSPLLTAVAIGLTLLPLVASLLTGKQLQTLERRVSDRNRDFTAALNDCLNGFSVVKTFRAEREIFRLFSESNRALEQEKFRKNRVRRMVGMIGAGTGIVAQLGVFLIGAGMALDGYGLTAGTVILFVNLMNFLIEPVATLPGLLASRRAARGLIEKLAEALEKSDGAAGTRQLAPLREGLRLEHVSFGYEEGKDVLHDVSVVFEAGKAYAVVGGSGCGKSTLLHLLSASCTGYCGTIHFDDTELREIAPESLYEQISVIQQNVFVFDASLRDNITMFRDFPHDAVDSAIERAHLNALVEERGEGYRCGEGGKGLSGGEKQRVSVARSLLKRSSVLLADEMTAALDAKTAHEVTSDLLALDGITRIVVTHGLEEALLRSYDGIIVLKDGRIAEQGRFDELMAQKGYFYALFTVSQ